MFKLFKRNKKQLKPKYYDDAKGSHTSTYQATAAQQTDQCEPSHHSDSTSSIDSSSSSDGGACGGGD